MEAESAILIEYKELVAGSGGDGAHRGGLAQEIKVRNNSSKPMYVSLIAERTKTAPKGIQMVDAGDAFIVRSHGGVVAAFIAAAPRRLSCLRAIIYRAA